MLRRQKLYKNPDVYLYREDFFAYLTDLQNRGALHELPQNLYVYYVLNTLSGEVNNGGFVQFLTNSSRLVFWDLLPCAKLLDVPAFTALIQDLTDAVDSWLAAHHADLESAAYDDAICGQLEEFDRRFFALNDDGLWKKILNYYKTNFTAKFIRYEAVKELPGPGCSYFTPERQSHDVPELVRCLFAFLEEFEVSWRIVFFEDCTLSAIPERECFDLDEFVAHFANPFYSFRTHRVEGIRTERTALANLGCLYVNQRNPQDPDRPDYRSVDQVKVTPSDFSPREYKIKRRFQIGWFRGSPLDTDEEMICFEIRAEKPGLPLAFRDEIKQAVLDQVKEHPCVLSVVEKKVSMEEVRIVSEEIFRRSE